MAVKKRDKPGQTEDMEGLLAGIDKEFGNGTVMRLGDHRMAAVETFPSGSIALDEALGIGGFPYGRIIEIYGPESSGKTSLALHATGNVQRQGKRAAFIDAEHAFDPNWAAILGVDTEDIYMSQPDNGEQALRVADRLVRSGLFGVITIDSVAALVPKAELDGEIGDTHVGGMARMMSQGLRMLSGPCADTGTSIMFINQLREKVGVFFGNAETQPGGKALKFYSTIRLDVRRIQTLKSGDKATGSRVRVKVVKNKLAAPFGTAEFDFMFGEGVSYTAQLVDIGVERGVVKKSGAFYSWHKGEDLTAETVALGQGKETAREYLAAHPDTAAEIDAAIRSAVPAPEARKPARGTGNRDGLVMEGDAPWEGDGEEVLSSDT